jgi:hypothetical protein
MSISSRFVSVSLQSHRMWSVVRFTAQKGYSGLGSLSITAEWVALVYPVRKWLLTTLASGHRFGICVHYVVWFAIFHGCGRVFPFFLLFLSVGDMFRCGELPCSVLLLLRFHVRDSEPIVM